ncbi:MAG: hypothetical protein R3F61_09010 [Myxococcota bacterium]
MAHAWRFVRVGGFDQVKLERGADLVALDQLDQKLWVALACPVLGLEFDARTLQLIDTDNDGRVRASELIAATKWVGEALADVEVLAKAPASIPVTAIADTTDFGKQLRESARSLLKGLGRPESEIGVDDVKAATEAFDKEPLNGDGIIVPATGTDEALQQTITDVLACTKEPKTDRSGAPGVDGDALAAFYEAVTARVAWLDAGADDAVRPVGDGTAAGHGALTAVRAKIDDFFGRCRVAAFDGRALDAVNRRQEEYLAIAAEDLHVTADEIAHFPIAMVAPDKPLPLQSGVNPAWAAKLEALRTAVLAPLGKDGEALDEAGWRDVCGRFAGYEAWLGAEAGTAVAALSEERLRALAAGDERGRLEELIALDAAEKPVADQIESVERLVRYCRDLMPLANNFVSFRDFYNRERSATFQVGTLYLDQRACSLCIRVNDAGRHATMAPRSAAYLLYCDLKNAAGEKMSIVAAMTDGDVDNLMVGRNGVFYDRSGKDWDATVTKIVENPISIRQAFWSPYKKFLRTIEEMIAARAQAAETESQGKVAAAAASTKDAASGTAVQAKPIDVGMVAALGVAVGGITAAIGALLQAFFGLGLWMPLGVLGLVLLISGPSMVVAWLKLRQRNLGPLLDANGWAVNAQAKVNVPLGRSLTTVAALPNGTIADRRDPYAERTQPWWLYFVLVALLGSAFGWYIGALDAYLPGPAKSITVLGELAPAATANAIEAAAAEAAAAEAAGTPAPAPAPAE